MSKNILLAILLTGFSIMANAGNDTSLNVSAEKNSFIVTLPANPTTGFQWTVTQYDKNLLTLSSSQYKGPDTKLIGAGGQMQFTFSVNKKKALPKQTTLLFKYTRSWEANTGSMQKVTVKFE